MLGSRQLERTKRIRSSQKREQYFHVRSSCVRLGTVWHPPGCCSSFFEEQNNNDNDANGVCGWHAMPLIINEKKNIGIMWIMWSDDVASSLCSHVPRTNLDQIEYYVSRFPLNDVCRFMHHLTRQKYCFHLFVFPQSTIISIQDALHNEFQQCLCWDYVIHVNEASHSFTVVTRARMHLSYSYPTTPTQQIALQFRFLRRCSFIEQSFRDK